jgi:hypothetical protein
MSSEDRVFKALDALKNADRELGASPGLEARLVESFRERHAKRGRARWVTLVAIAAGAILMFRLGRTTAPRQEFPPAQAAVSRPAQSIAIPERGPDPVVVVRPKVRLQRIAQAPREIVTEFFPLMDAAPPVGRGQLLRVAVPASTLRSVGLPVREERLNEPVQADVLIGEEGMARAIRFVQQY